MSAKHQAVNPRVTEFKKGGQYTGRHNFARNKTTSSFGGVMGAK